MKRWVHASEESSGYTLQEAAELYQEDAEEGDYYTNVKVIYNGECILDCKNLNEVFGLNPWLLDTEVSRFYWHDTDIVFIL